MQVGGGAGQVCTGGRDLQRPGLGHRRTPRRSARATGSSRSPRSRTSSASRTMSAVGLDRLQGPLRPAPARRAGARLALLRPRRRVHVLRAAQGGDGSRQRPVASTHFRVFFSADVDARLFGITFAGVGLSGRGRGARRGRRGRPDRHGHRPDQDPVHHDLEDRPLQDRHDPAARSRSTSPATGPSPTVGTALWRGATTPQALYLNMGQRAQARRRLPGPRHRRRATPAEIFIVEHVCGHRRQRDAARQGHGPREDLRRRHQDLRLRRQRRRHDHRRARACSSTSTSRAAPAPTRSCSTAPATR